MKAAAPGTQRGGWMGGGGGEENKTLPKPGGKRSGNHASTYVDLIPGDVLQEQREGHPGRKNASHEQVEVEQHKILQAGEGGEEGGIQTTHANAGGNRSIRGSSSNNRSANRSANNSGKKKQQ